MEQILSADGVTPLASSYSGASRGFGNQLADWNPRPKSVDAALTPRLDIATGRAEDLIRNNGIASNAVQLHKDHIVGSDFRLSYKPNWKVLGLKEDTGFVAEVEAIFGDIANDPGCFIDAERKRTFTMLIRECVGNHTFTGDMMAKVDWIDDPHSHISTAIKMICPRTVSNPHGKRNTSSLVGGVEVNQHNQALSYHVEEGTGEFGTGKRWVKVPKFAQNGRLNFIHVFEPMEGGQTRGVNSFMTTMEQLKMFETLQLTTLQQEVMKAMYSASIESELGTEEAMQFLLGAGGSKNNAANIEKLLLHYADYYEGNQVKFNGIKVPHLFPGDKINLNTPGNSLNGFSALEKSLLRFTAAGLNLDYAQLSRDYSQMSFSTVKASANDSWRYCMGQRKLYACRLATMIFSLLFEEFLARKYITLPRGARYSFYERRHAWTRSDWIGAGRMAIDGLKEVKEAILLIEGGLSTYEKEAAKLGEDYQELFAQQVKEMEMRSDKGLPPPSWMKLQALAPDNDQVEEG